MNFRFKPGLFSVWTTVSGLIILIFILLPVLNLLTAPSIEALGISIKDKTVINALWLSIFTSGMASLVVFVAGTPFAYILARKNFPAKKLVEGIVDLPVVIPHPVVGIAILGVAGRDHWLGELLYNAGIRLMGSKTGIIVVLVFVGMPFYINAVKRGIEDISPRLENVSRSLGSGRFETFFRVVFPLAGKSMLTGLILCCARCISEFGAVVVVAYHPMTAPVLIFERFEGYGLEYSQPVSVLLVLVCLVLFLAMRFVSFPWRKIQ